MQENTQGSPHGSIKGDFQATGSSGSQAGFVFGQGPFSDRLEHMRGQKPFFGKIIDRILFQNKRRWITVERRHKKADQATGDEQEPPGVWAGL